MPFRRRYLNNTFVIDYWGLSVSAADTPRFLGVYLCCSDAHLRRQKRLFWQNGLKSSTLICFGVFIFIEVPYFSRSLPKSGEFQQRLLRGDPQKMGGVCGNGI